MLLEISFRHHKFKWSPLVVTDISLLNHTEVQRVYFIPRAFDVKTYIRRWVGAGKDLAAGMSGSKQPKDSVQNAAMNDTSILVRNQAWVC